MAPQTGLILGAFVAGLLGSPHCVGMCGPFALACAGPGRRSAAWHVGRIATYAGLGGLAGGFGAVLPGPQWLAAVLSAALIVWFSAVLAGVVPEPRWTPAVLRRAASSTLKRGGGGATLLFGLANGFLPCGLVYTALGLAVATTDPLAGALVMVAFGLGTVPLLVVLTAGARRIALKDLRVRRVLAVLVLASGLLSIAFRSGKIGMVGMQGHEHGGAPAVESVEPSDSGSPDAQAL